MKSQISYAGLSHVGLVRDMNEDRWAADPDLGLFFVTDGMGGGPFGEEAAQKAAGLLTALCRLRLRIRQGRVVGRTCTIVREVLEATSHRVREEFAERRGTDGAGAAIMLALIQDETLVLGHMGDSRAYLLRRGRLNLLTQDHTLVRLLVDAGDVTPEEARSHPARCKLTRFAGMPGHPLPEVQTLPLVPGDRLLLCTDGLHELLEERTITSLLRAATIPAKACRQLVRAALAAGGRDNVTAMVLAIAGASGR